MPTDDLSKKQAALALLIGQSLILEDMFKLFFPSAITHLGCSAAYLWLKKPNQNEASAYLSPAYCYPTLHSHIRTIYPQVCAFVQKTHTTLWDNPKATELHNFNNIPFTVIPLLGGSGVLLLQRTEPFNENEATTFAPIFEHFMRSCRLCMEHETIKTAKKSAQQKVKKAEHANRSKDEFLAVMSHELRTPLHGIIGLTSLTLDTQLNEQQHTSLKSIKSSAYSLLSIIDEILNTSQLGTRALRLKNEAFQLKPLIENTLLPFKGSTNKKQLTLNIQLDKNIDKTIISDSVKIKQIINSLMSNALKFTTTGSITFSAHPIDVSSTMLGIKFSIHDTGCGIKKELIQHITKPFTLADNSHARRHGGIGLGLTVCQNFIKLFGSELHIESEENTGTTVSFSLHFRTTDNSNIAPTQSLLPSKLKCNILLAEDNIINRLVAEQILVKLGHTVLVAEDGHQAVSSWTSIQPDVILMDIQMPEMDGLEATKAIRKEESQNNKSRTPIIALTANARKSDQEACMNAGMDYFIAKPFNAEKLQEALIELSSTETTKCAKAI